MSKRDYTNLRNKTVFDVFTDKELKKAGINIKYKQNFITCANEDLSTKAMQYMQVSLHIKDGDKLAEAVEEQFGDVTIPRFE